MWSVDRPDSVWIKTPQQASRLKEKMANKRYAAFDTETTGTNIVRDYTLFWSLSLGDDRYFLERKMLDEFRPVFKDPKRIWIGTNTKFDAHMVANCGIHIRGKLYCTLVMDRLLDSERPHGLKETYEREFGEKVQTFGETFYPRNKAGKPYKPKGKTTGEIILDKWEEAPEDVIEYASLDAWMSYRLYCRLKKQLKQTTSWRGEDLWSVYLDMEMPFTKILYCCERMGTLIDTGYLKSLKEPMLEEMELTAKALNKAAGRIVNVKSTPQLQELFYKKLRMKVGKKTKKGAPSTDSETLEKWAAQGVKEAQLVLRYRKVQKIESTYVSGILKAVDDNNRLHGSLNQHVTKTGRLSSSEPNMQNFPKPSTDEFQIRKAFIARPGYSFVSADYSQLEMYLMAHWSGDPNMVKAILDGRDLHAANAAMIWSVPYEDIIAAIKRKDAKQPLSDYDKTLLGYRQYAKTICFGQQRSGGRRETCSKRGNLSAAA